MSESVEIAGIGEPLVALAPSSGTLTPFVAGAELNVVIGARRLGVGGTFAGAVGDDWFGAFIRDHLEEEGVDHEHVEVDANRPTGIFVKEVRADGEPDRRYCRRGSAGSELLPVAALTRAIDGVRAVVVSGLTTLLSSTAATRASTALRTAFERGLTTVLDLNIRGGLALSDAAAQSLRLVLPHTRFLLGSTAELRTALEVDVDTSHSLARIARDRYPALNLVAVRDADGAGLLDDSGWSYAAHAGVEVRDASGAGDAFTAGSLVAHLRSLPRDEVLGLGLRCAALQMKTPGDCDGIAGLAVEA